MKNLITFLLVFAVITSCRKNSTCTCTSEKNPENSYKVSWKLSKKTAQNWCAEKNEIAKRRGELCVLEMK
jgi:hypothetical protein